MKTSMSPKINILKSLKQTCVIALLGLNAGSAFALPSANSPIRGGAGAEDVKVYLEEQAKRDIQELHSCFKGEIAKKDKEMLEQWEKERYVPGQPELAVAKVDELVFPPRFKVCDYLDVKKRKTTDYEQARSKRCANTDESSYVAAVTFANRIAGGHQIQGVVFKIKIVTVTQAVLQKDASYYPEESEIISYKVRNRITCEPIAF